MKSAENKVEVKELAPCRKEISIEVGAQEMENERNRILKDFSREAKIPGFRPGKAPISVIESRFGPDARQEALRNKLSESFFGTCKQQDLAILGSPEFKDISWEEGGPLSFKASFDISPEFDLGNWKGLKLTKPTTVAQPEEIEAEIENLRERSATFETVEARELATEDFALVDYKTKGKDEADNGEWVEGLMLEIKTPDEEGFSEQLIGMKPGDIREVVLKPKNDQPEASHQKIEIRLSEIKHKTLPQLDDTLASSWGPFKTLDEVREKIGEAISQQREQSAKIELEKQALEQLRTSHDFDLPPQALKSFAEGQLEMMKKFYQGKDEAPEEEELISQAHNLATGELKTIFLLRKIAEQEKIEITLDQLGEEINQEAAYRNINPADYRKQLEENDELGSVEDRIRRRIALDKVIESADIKEESNV